MDILIKNALKNNFDTALSRDKVVCKSFTTGEEYPVFLRRYADNRSERNVQTMYFSADYSDILSAGKIIEICGNYWVMINCETPENEIYRKSTIIQCNGSLSTVDRTVVGLPVYCDPIVNDNQTNNDKFAFFLDGDTDAICEWDNPLTQALRISDVVTIYNTFFKITNKYNVAGVCHFIIEMTEKPAIIADSDSFTGVIFGLNSTYTKSVEETDMMELKVYNNGVPMRATIVTYHSNNPTVATIDPSSGKINYLSNGEVTFTALCQNLDFAKSVAVTVGEADGGDYEINFAPNDTLFPIIDNTVESFITCGGVKDTTHRVSYKIEPEKYTSEVALKSIDDGVIITINGKTVDYDEKFTIIAYNDELGVSTSKEITVGRIF